MGRTATTFLGRKWRDCRYLGCLVSQPLQHCRDVSTPKSLRCNGVTAATLDIPATARQRSTLPVMKWLLVATLLFVGCGGPTTPSSVAPLATATSIPTVTQGAFDPCVHATTFLGAFMSQLSIQIAGLRPLIVAKQFDAPTTGTAVLRINATFTAFDGIGQAVGDCPPTADLGPRVDRFIKTASASLNKATSGSINDGQLQRDAAANLFGLLPDVIALSAANKTIADELAMTAASAQIADADAKPLGSLPPLSTPRPATTPRPTSALTPQPGTGASGSGAARAKVNAYLDSVQATYSKMVGAGYWPGGCEPGDNPELCAAKIAAEEARQVAISAIRVHLTYLNDHPLRCLDDAYAADRAVLRLWSDILAVGFIAAGISGPQAEQRTTAFSEKLPAYYADCF